MDGTSVIIGLIAGAFAGWFMGNERGYMRGRMDAQSGAEQYGYLAERIRETEDTIEEMEKNMQVIEGVTDIQMNEIKTRLSVLEESLPAGNK